MVLGQDLVHLLQQYGLLIVQRLVQLLQHLERKKKEEREKRRDEEEKWGENKPKDTSASLYPHRTATIHKSSAAATAGQVGPDMGQVTSGSITQDGVVRLTCILSCILSLEASHLSIYTLASSTSAFRPWFCGRGQCTVCNTQCVSIYAHTYTVHILYKDMHREHSNP